MNTVAVGTDGSETADKAVDFAIDMARRYEAELVVASCYRPVSEARVKSEQKDVPEDVKWSINPTEDVDATLRAAEEKAQAAGLRTVSEARMGDPADVLCEIAEQRDADVLIVGNKGMTRRVLGSVPNSVSHKAPCSVLIVKTA